MIYIRLGNLSISFQDQEVFLFWIINLNWKSKVKLSSSAVKSAILDQMYFVSFHHRYSEFLSNSRLMREVHLMTVNQSVKEHSELTVELHITHHYLIHCLYNYRQSNNLLFKPLFQFIALAIPVG